MSTNSQNPIGLHDLYKIKFSVVKVKQMYRYCCNRSHIWGTAWCLTVTRRPPSAPSASNCRRRLPAWPHSSSSTKMSLTRWSTFVRGEQSNFAFNPTPARVIYLNFHPLEVVARYRDPQLQAVENY